MEASTADTASTSGPTVGLDRNAVGLDRNANAVPWTRGNRVVGYDPERRRVWIGGQRLHHGLTGIVLAGAGLVRFSWRRRLARRRRALAWTAAGGALIAHDWKDRAAWFRRGAQTP